MPKHISVDNLETLNKKNNRLRCIISVFVLFCLILIWPLGFFDTADLNTNNRLLKEDDYYTYFYVSSGGYITTVLYGDGSYIENGAIRLHFQNEVQDDAVMHAYMYDSSGNLVVDRHINLFPRPSNDVYEIPFEITMNKSEAYQFILAPDSEFTVGVYCFDQTSEPVVVMHSRDLLSSQIPGRVLKVLKACIWICGITFIIMLLVGDRLKNLGGTFLSFPKKVFVPALLSLIFLMVYGQYLFDHNIESDEGLIKGAFLIIILTVFVFLSSFLHKHELIIYGFLIIAVGSIYILAFPAGNIPDEINHFYRAFSLAFGNLQSIKFSDTSVGAVLPVAIQKSGDYEAVFDFADTIQIEFNNTSLYSPVCYIPQILGIRLALLFTTNVHSVFMAARWAGFIGAFILYMISLRVIPVGRKLMFVVMMLPMTLQEMTGVTSDGMTNAFAFVFIAVILNRVLSVDKMSRKDIAIITILGTLVGMCKIVYIVLLLLLLLLPLTQNSSKTMGGDNSKRRASDIKTYGVMFGMPIIMCLISNSFFGQNLISNGENIDAGKQIVYVLTHIPATIMTVIRSTVEYGMQWIGEMTGDWLGLLCIRTLPLVTLILVVVIIISAQNVCLPDMLKSGKASWIYGLISFFGFLLILGSIYATWNTVGDFFIRGIQGRYFIAILPVFGLFVATIGNRVFGRDNSEQTEICDFQYLEAYILLLINMIVVVDIYTYLIMNG